MDEFYNRHYITVNEAGRITHGWSDGPNPERDTTNAICINEQGGYQFRLKLCSGYGYPESKGILTETSENPPLYTMDGIPLYKWDGESVQKRTDEEIEADRAAIPDPPPSPMEQIRADVDFLAIMQGVTL